MWKPFSVSLMINTPIRIKSFFLTSDLSRTVLLVNSAGMGTDTTLFEPLKREKIILQHASKQKLTIRS